jgi:outer membrane protein assembly factor BamA
MAPGLLRRSLCLCLAVIAAAGCRESEGIEVKTLEFSGLQAVTKDQLEQVIVTAASSPWPLGPRHLFEPAQFEADLKRIVAFYRDRGFPEARIVSADVTLNRDQTAVSIRIDLVEGEPIVVEDVRFTGFDVLPEEEFAAFRARRSIDWSRRRFVKRRSTSCGTAGIRTRRSSSRKGRARRRGRVS